MTAVSTGRRLGGLALALAGGVALATQSRINGELGSRLGDGVAAALVSTGSGFVVLVAAAMALPVGRRGVRAFRDALRTHKLRWWHCAGGVTGSYFVAMQGVTVARIGLAVFTVAAVAGQVSSSLFVDRAGLGPGGPRPVTTNRVIAATLAVVAVVVAVADRVGSPTALGLAVLPALAGAGIAWQQAMNGRVQAATHASTATLVNFSVAVTTLALVYAVVAPLRGLPSQWPSAGNWWLYTGGLLGILFILTTVVVVRVVGVLVLGLGAIAGQVLASLAFDVIVPAKGDHLGMNTVVGALLTLAAVLVAARRPPVGPAGPSAKRATL